MEDTQHKRRDALIIAAVVAVLSIAVIAVTYRVAEPAPPKKITIGTGSEHGAYYAFGERYRDILARHDIELEVLPTRGSIDNVRRLEAGEIDVAFVQGGCASDASGLESLGSLYYEPLWVFHREPNKVEVLRDLYGKRLAIGPVGSGTRAVAVQLLADNGIDAAPTELLALDGAAASEALRAGEVDAVFLVASPDSKLVGQLLADRDVNLMSFRRAQAYVRRRSYLSAVTLPEGALDLERNLPSEDKTLVAPTANLVARKELHPALVQLLARAAKEVHSDGGLFASREQFPTPKYTELPMNDTARHYYEDGPSFLQRYVPFWAVAQIDRLKFLLLPLLALLFPLLRMFGPAYRWRVRSRIYRSYRAIQGIERTLRDEEHSEAQYLEQLAHLDAIEAEVFNTKVPLSYADEQYDLRLHIELVRDHLRRRAAEAGYDLDLVPETDEDGSTPT